MECDTVVSRTAVIQNRRFRRQCVAAVIGLTATVAASSASAAYLFTTVNDPLATGGTIVWDVNNSGSLAGNYYDSVGFHGFVDTGGVFTTVDNPAALPGTTWVSGMNDAGSVVGQYRDAAGYHGFVETGGVFTTLDYPSVASGTSATRINSGGTIVGFYNDFTGIDGDGTGIHGFSEVGGVFSTIEAPMTFTGGTVPYGVNDNGVIVGTYLIGSYTAPSGYGAFVDDGGAFTSFSGTNADLTSAFDINANGTVVGYYRPAVGERGFVFDGSTFTTIADPSATGVTRVYGINDDGDIVGYYADRAGEHGFLASLVAGIPEPATWIMMMIGFFGLGFALRRQRKIRSGFSAV